MFGNGHRIGMADPTGPTSGSNRILRGGSWDAANSSNMRSARPNLSPDFRNGALGFRLNSTHQQSTVRS